MTKNYKPPSDVYITLLLPTLRRLSKTSARTASYICEQLRQQTKALGSRKDLPDLESTDFATAVRTTLKILVALRYAQVMPRITPWEKRKYLLTPLGAELTCTPHLNGAVPARVVKQVQTLCAQNLSAKSTKSSRNRPMLSSKRPLSSPIPPKIQGRMQFSPWRQTLRRPASLRREGLASDGAGFSGQFPQSTPLDVILKASKSPIMHAQAEFAEHFTQDLIRHIYAVTPEYFEHIVADIFTALGFITEVTGGVDDKGVDVVARYSDGLDFAPIYIQVKHYCGTIKVTPNEIQKLAGAVLLHGGLQGVLVTCGAFAQPVPEYLQGLPGARNIALVDQHKLVELMIRHRVGVREGEGNAATRLTKSTSRRA